MYLEKRVFVGISTFTASFMFGWWLRERGKVVIKEIDDLQFIVLSKIFQLVGWLVVLGLAAL